MVYGCTLNWKGRLAEPEGEEDGVRVVNSGTFREIPHNFYRILGRLPAMVQQVNETEDVNRKDFGSQSVTLLP